MKVIKPLGLAFLVGGAFAIVGQGFTMLWFAILGGDTPLLGFAILVSMGVVGALMYIIDIHQPLVKAAGFGAILPFNGFCAAIADAYLRGAQQTGSAAKGVTAALKLVAYILGIGCVLIAVVAAIVFFIVGG